MVALLAEGVDRNAVDGLGGQGELEVALLAGGVDINLEAAIKERDV